MTLGGEDSEWDMETVRTNLALGGGFCVRLRVSESQGIARMDVYQDFDRCTSIHALLDAGGWTHVAHHIAMPPNSLGNMYLHPEPSAETLRQARRIVWQARAEWPGAHFTPDTPVKRSLTPRHLWPKFGLGHT